MVKRVSKIPQTSDNEWVTFPGGELEGQRPNARCSRCRARPNGAARASPPPLCFQCYRAGLERDKTLKAAGRLDTASEARFQCTLPFDPVNRARLEALKAGRTAERAEMRGGVGRFVERRRLAQIKARHALQMIGAGLSKEPRAAAAAIAAAVHAAELQLPESWLPFIVARGVRY